uniref:Putative ovule protein n=1 Tax=Solanum chacoense TaxID=4108 RepID=A0A0V0GRE2_SOLCH
MVNMTPGRNCTALDNICTQEGTPQRFEENNSSLISIEEAVPLNQKNLEEEDDPEFDMSIWIHQNILKFAKDFGVDIKGCKEEATLLFMKIDSMRQINNDKGKEIAKLTSAVKGAKELKSLECGSIFRSNGTRSKGGYTISGDQ